MDSTKIADLMVKIESLNKQIDSCVKQIKDNNDLLSSENIALEQQKNERQKLESSIRSLGFFKFKERKPLKEALSIINGKINITEAKIYELKNKSDSLVKQEKELKIKKENIRREKDKQEKELHLIEKALQGDSQAQFDVANLFFDKKDENKAMDWLRKAVEQGHGEAKKLILQIEEDKKRILSASHDITLW